MYWGEKHVRGKSDLISGFALFVLFCFQGNTDIIKLFWKHFIFQKRLCTIGINYFLGVW